VCVIVYKLHLNGPTPVSVAYFERHADIAVDSLVTVASCVWSASSTVLWRCVWEADGRHLKSSLTATILADVNTAACLCLLVRTRTHTHTHTYRFNGPLSGITRVSRYQKGKTNLDFPEARDSEWQWHQLSHMQVCTSLQTDNHASTPSLSFLQAGCPSCRPTNSVKALKGFVSPHRGSN